MRTISFPIFILFAIALLNACRATHQHVTREILVGAYVFECDAPSRTPSHQIGERLRLQNDGMYELDHGGQSGSEAVITGRWTFRNGNPPTIYLDHAGFPVDSDGGNIRLVVNDDVNARYEKDR